MRSSDPRSPGDTRSTAQSMLLAEPTKAPEGNWREHFPEIIGRSQVMAKVLETVSKVARSDSAVLILGESGTGKESIAHAIHRLSPRSDKTLVPLNCSAIPENLLESELFGHEKGAFTGADRRKIGKFEYASGGTIFLDEIGDMPAMLQAKLLRVLQDKKFAPLGGNDLHEVDVRVIAATNINLDQAIKSGRFRQDLFYRLNVLPVHLPPLRDRAEDIPELLEHFVRAANRVHALSGPCFLSEQLVQCLCTYRWPGNIRQLQNLIERLVVLKGGGLIDVSDLPQELGEMSELSDAYAAGTTSEASPRAAYRASATMPLPRPLSANVRLPEGFGTLPDQGFDLVKFIEDLENDFIRQALDRTGNNRNQAARLLGLNRTTLVERIKKRRITALNEPSKEL